MTSVTDRPRQEPPEVAEVKKRNRFLTVTLVVVAVALIGLGAWVVFDGDSAEVTPPAEVLEVIANFEEAISTDDVELLESTLAEDFTWPYAWYPVGGSRTFLEGELSRAETVHRTTVNDRWVEWIRSPIGDLTTIGEGPWHVSMPTRWDLQGGAWEGITIYTVVEDDAGRKLISETYFTGTAALGGQ